MADPHPVVVYSKRAKLEDVRDDLKLAIEESKATITPDPLPTVLGDSVQLVQLFQNLLGNALKFHGKDAPAIHVGVERRGREWCFAVRDNGIGIAQPERARIFDDFYRAPGTRARGSGLGLAICRHIMEAHDGEIEVARSSPEGTTFALSFPASILS